jgi:sortase A
MAVQVVVAASLPWLVARVIAPDQLGWAVLTVGGVLAFAALHARSPAIWLLPASAVVSVLPAVGDVPAAVLALTVAGVLMAWPPDPGVPRVPALRWAAAGLLVGAGLLLGASAIIGIRAADDDFTASQQAAAEAWDAPLVAIPTAQFPSGSGAIASGESVPLSSNASDGSPGPVSDSAPAVAPPPPAIAQLAFRRPGDERPPVTDGVLYVGSDVTQAALAAGPGHYPSTSLPGREGNFAVAGHRTGWGSPFLELDELKAGDEVLVTDRNDRTFTYVVAESVLVDPDESWVLGQDPLETGQPTLTLTTCDPPNVNNRRLIVFGILAEEG